MFLLLVQFAQASHYRAGEIVFRQISQLEVEATVITYALNNSADQPFIELDWGDGTVQDIARTNGNIVGGVGLGEFIPNAGNTKKNIYGPVRHIYSGALPFFVISIAEPYREPFVCNVDFGSSGDELFYIEDTIRIFDPSFVGLNTSPILLNPPIDYAKVGEVFEHNPAAFDVDGDSLVYQLIPSLQGSGFPVNNYRFPEETNPQPDILTIDPLTGDIVWDAPPEICTYNIAILITEYRNGIELGTIMRDMQIVVEDNLNSPPELADVKDTCIIAGSPLELELIAGDIDSNQTVFLQGFGGPLDVPSIPAPAATLTTTGTNPVNGLFEWGTNCDHIRRQPYQVTFKASDNFSPGGTPRPLVDLETWRIQVVAPAPQNVQTSASGNSIEVSWRDPYLCSSTDKFIGFSVWRRIGSNPFIPENCEVGLAGKGYTKIADRLETDYSYIDSNVVRGNNYCYRVLAEFAERTTAGLLYNKVESLPSNEACSELSRDVPIITKASVEATDVSKGAVDVTWSKPLAGTNGLDTLQLPGPYEYKVLRGLGLNATVFTEIQSFTSPTFFSHNDTTFTDLALNTLENPYSYKIEFYANGTFVGASEVASTVFLELVATDNRMELTWSEQVPWQNETYNIYRADFGSPAYNLIDNTTTQLYTDRDVVNDSLYCYYIESDGGYSVSGIIDPILNNSQQACARPIDTIPPCPPVLTVVNDCPDVEDGEFCSDDVSLLQNQLNWTNPENACEGIDDVEKYYVYFRSPLEDSFRRIDSLFSSADTFYSHSTLSGSLAGCYYVTSVDVRGNESERSEEVCVDNCPCYKLPNVFTPNGDGSNDFFIPFLPYRYIDKIDLKVFDRWGTLVFETDDPNINWDGKDPQSGKPLKEGTYFYVCETFEIREDGIVKSPEPLEGYIYLIVGGNDIPSQ